MILEIILGLLVDTIFTEINPSILMIIDSSQYIGLISVILDDFWFILMIIMNNPILLIIHIILR